jgi:hypothetical protein
VISTPKFHETASVQEVSHLDQLNLITPSPALHRFLLTAEPTYDGDKLTHSDICSVLSKYVLQNYHSIKTERTKILKLSQHNPLYRLFRVNFIHRCQIQSFLSMHLHLDSKPTMTLDIQNSKNIKITVTKVHDNKPATDGVKSIPGSTLILQLQEELQCNQKNLEISIAESLRKDRMISSLLSKISNCVCQNDDANSSNYDNSLPGDSSLPDTHSD